MPRRLLLRLKLRQKCKHHHLRYPLNFFLLTRIQRHPSLSQANHFRKSYDMSSGKKAIMFWLSVSVIPKLYFQVKTRPRVDECGLFGSSISLLPNRV